MASVIDFHTHILPGIDDGSKSLEDSLAMLQCEAEQGIDQVIATPHFYAHHQKLPRFLEKRRNAQKLLQDAIQNRSDLPELKVGAEVYYFEGISKSEALAALAIEDSPYVMIEMPMGEWTERNYEELEEIYTNWNLIPIVAHIDRYISPLHTHKIPERLAELPVMVQANASFFIQRTTRRLALKLLKKDQIHLLGSDCHNLTMRPPVLGEAIKIIRRTLGQKAIEQILAHQQEMGF